LDAGIVAVLDRRIVRKGYGRALIASLPPARRVRGMDDLRAFWQAIDRHDEGRKETIEDLSLS
jgi:ATP-dependent DNA helicase DinG